MTDDLVTLTLPDGREIRPRMVDGEPVCDRGCDIYMDGGR
jgi:hypothetical protein